jgi:hypothetical protein
VSTTQTQIRELLRAKENEDGLTPPQIGKILRRKPGHVHDILETMSHIDAYIDRWEPCPCPGGYSPVWMVVQPPESAPRPDPRLPMKFPKEKTNDRPDRRGLHQP